ncbi:MAG TPA: hypothetical protein PL072_07615 [Phycisphaerales bacterium]|mgnify:FL=1|nr:hypothetical protein [Phycisphaerales bacterium]
MDPIKFETGATYTTTSACDSNCVFAITVVSRTAKTIKTVDKHGEARTYRTSVYDGAERVSMGSYSMAPGFSARK